MENVLYLKRSYGDRTVFLQVLSELPNHLFEAIEWVVSAGKPEYSALLLTSSDLEDLYLEGYQEISAQAYRRAVEVPRRMPVLV